MHRHQAYSINGVDRRVRLVSHRELLQVVRDPCEGGVTAILDSSEKTTQFLQVLARLQTASSAKFKVIRRIVKDAVQEFGWRHPVDPRQPALNCRACDGKNGSIFL
jgi:hypothetical protein